MVHAKIFGGVLERSLLFFIQQVLILLVLVVVPAQLFMQTARGQSVQRQAGKNGEGIQLQLSPAFLNGRKLTQNTGFRAGNLSQAAAGIIQQPAAPVYDIVALRVSFQPDTSRFTTGDGTFTGALFDSLQSNVDPLPHNAEYFDAHLQFLANYVARVSDDKTRLNTHLIPEEIQVSQPMAAYSPTGFEASSDAELSKLAGLVEEAWTLASQQSSFDMSGFDPATTAFVLFHAGVGRDIELVGTSLEKTPQDLPTIFFNDLSLERLLPGTQISFNGFPVEHTILMPRTESRIGFDFIQDIPFLVEFSINGLLAASFFNFLEVPDLFNTVTGESAIGPFGLMDPLGLFAYNGLFPPEPGAWTKLYLGWADLIDVDVALEQTISLSAMGVLDENEVARIPISASEYFLVENRDRDVENDGLTLTIYRDGRTYTQLIENGDVEFNSINIDGFQGGVVVDADDFDWALPGGIDADDNELAGGILIWHIDERILAEGLAENSVNVDVLRRGVDLEEADGAQDLGFPSDNIFGPQAFLGSPFDFFYEDNPIVVINSAGEEIRLYQNSFGPATFPNSNSNADGPSFIVLDDFTPPDASMSFRLSRQNEKGITPVDGYPVTELEIEPDRYITSVGENTIAFEANTGNVRILAQGAPTQQSITASALTAPIVLPDGRTVMLAFTGEAFEPMLLSLSGNQETLTPLDFGPDYSAGVARSNMLYDEVSNSLFAFVAGIQEKESVYQIRIVNNDENVITRLSLTDFNMFSMAATDEGQIAVLGNRGVFWATGEIAWNFSLDDFAQVGQLALGKDATGTIGVFPVLSENALLFLQADQSTVRIDLNQHVEPDESGQISAYPLLVDLDNDGILEALVTSGTQLFAFSAGGGMADGFPVNLPASVSTQPLIASMGETESWTVFLGASDGYIYALDLQNPTIPTNGFPLALGTTVTTSPLLDGNTLFGVDISGDVQAWGIESLGSIWWGEQRANHYNTSFVKLDVELETSVANELLISGENYNWPNPIRDGETYFRLAPSQDVRVTITIIDAAGGLIDKLVAENVRGATTTDILWQTDAASGLYFARVEAVAADGTSETKLIRMAIVR